MGRWGEVPLNGQPLKLRYSNISVQWFRTNGGGAGKWDLVRQTDAQVEW